jgi:hypothetical protein
MSVNDLVSEYLKNNPHHVMSTQSGVGSQGKIGGSTPRTLKMSDLDLNNPTDRKLYSDMRKQRNQGNFKMKLTTNNN